MKTKYTISTDSVTTTIKANSADEAAMAFADSEKINGITGERALVAHYETLGGWCNICEQP